MTDVWTDGSVLKNPGGMGGWAFLVRYPAGVEFLHSGAEADTSNNRMELRAVIQALSFLHDLTRKAQVTIHCDSQYVIRGCSGQNRRLANRDMFDEFDSWAQYFEITWNWVKGHAGQPENERVDVAAGLAARSAWVAATSISY